MARIAFKPLNVSSLSDTKVTSVQNNELFIDDSNGLMYYKDSNGIIKQGLESEVNRFSKVKPSLLVDFENCEVVDSRLNFTRSSKATYVNQMGYIATAEVNEPRISYDPMTLECRGLLIEQLGRTNLFSYSTDILNPTAATANLWRFLNIAYSTASDIISPDNNVTPAYKLKLASNALTEDAHFHRYIMCSVDRNYVASVFVKAGNNPNTRVRLSVDGTTTGTVIFNPTTGTIISPSSTTNMGVEEYRNGWYRIWLHVNTTEAKNYAVVLRIENKESIDDFVYIWGPQFEQNSTTSDANCLCVSSYIPTTSTTVSRGRDIAKYSGNTFKSIFEGFTPGGTIIIEYIPIGKRTANTFLASITADANNYIGISYQGATNANASTYFVGSSTLSKNFATSGVAVPYFDSIGKMTTKTSKYGFSFANGGCIVASNGVAGSIVDRNNSSGVPVPIPTPTEIQLCERADGFFSNNYIKKIMYFNEPLDAIELAALTE